MRLPNTISRRSLRETIRREIASGVTQAEIARRIGLTECRMSLTMKSVDQATPSWAKIASYYGYGPGLQDHMYVRVEQMKEAA